MRARSHALLVLFLTALAVGCTESSGPAGDVFVILSGPTGDISSVLGVESDEPLAHVRLDSIELVGESGEVVSAEISPSLTSMPSGWRGLAGVLEDVPAGTYVELRVHLAWAGNTYDFGWPGNAELPAPAHIDVVLDAPLEVLADRDAVIELELDVDRMLEQIPDAGGPLRLVPAVRATAGHLSSATLPLRIQGLVRGIMTVQNFVLCAGDWSARGEPDPSRCFAVEFGEATGFFGDDGESIEAASLVVPPDFALDPTGAVGECDLPAPYVSTDTRIVGSDGELQPANVVQGRPIPCFREDDPIERGGVYPGIPWNHVTVIGFPVLQGDPEDETRNEDGLRIVRAVAVMKGGAFTHLTLPGELYRAESDELLFDPAPFIPEPYDGDHHAVLGDGARIFDRTGAEVEGLPEGDEVWQVTVDAVLGPHPELAEPVYRVSFARHEDDLDREEELLPPFGPAQTIVEGVNVEAGQLTILLGQNRLRVTATLAEDVRVRFAYVTYDEGAVSRPGSLEEIEPGMRIGIVLAAESPMAVEGIVAFTEPTHSGSCIDRFDCASTEYCARAAGFCEERGVCRPTSPHDCSLEPDPRCGCDGITYANSCEVLWGRVLHHGACIEP